MKDAADEAKAFLAKANEYEFRAAMCETEVEAREERRKMRHYRDMADEDSLARRNRDMDNMFRDMAKGRANKAEREAKRRIKLGQQSVEPRNAAVRAPMQTGEGLVVQMQPVVKNVKHDVLEYEYAHRRIDEAQYTAGNRFLSAFSRAGIGGAKAIDPAKAKVDSSPTNTTLSETVTNAIQELRAYAMFLGQADYSLLVATIGEGKTLARMAEMIGGPFASAAARKKAELYIGRRWKDALAGLAKRDGAKGPERQGVRVDVQERPEHRPETWEAHHVSFSSMRAVG